MITKKNFVKVMQSISVEEFQKEMNNEGDFILLEVHQFNTGSFTTIESIDYDDQIYEDTVGSGDIILDKDDFRTLLDEVNLLEKYEEI